jgi:hypothetical protein
MTRLTTERLLLANPPIGRISQLPATRTPTLTISRSAIMKDFRSSQQSFWRVPIFWDTTRYSPLKANGRFGVIWRLHLQGRSISYAWSKRRTANFLLGSFLDSEDRDMFLRNVGSFSTEYATLYPRRQSYSDNSWSHYKPVNLPKHGGYCMHRLL